MMPIIVARQINLRDAKRQKPETFSVKEILLIGLIGTLPDLLSPHIWIEQRHEAYSHSLFVLLAFAILTSPLFFKKKKFFLLSLIAYALHLFADYISGGIPLLSPFVKNIHAQHWLLPPIHWIIADICLLLIIYFQSWYRRFKI